MEKMMRVGKARRSVVRLAVLIILVTLFGSAVINTLAVTIPSPITAMEPAH
jgi:putative effector of murein hydrolase LrgA (UPF0299 family)